jgi:hypothetical protein
VSLRIELLLRATGRAAARSVSSDHEMRISLATALASSLCNVPLYVRSQATIVTRATRKVRSVARRELTSP